MQEVDPFPVKFPDGKWGFINEEGEVVIEPKFEDAWEFSEGLSVVKFKGKYGAINKKGEFVIEPRFRYLEGPSEGLFAFATRKNRVGFMDVEGRVVIKPSFKEATPFFEGRAFVTLQEWSLEYFFPNYDTWAELLKPNPPSYKDLPPLFSRFRKLPLKEIWKRRELPLLSRVYKSAFINREGEIIFKGEFFGRCLTGRTPRFKEGLAAVTFTVNDYGDTEAYFINKEGEIVLGPYELACNFSEGYAFVKKNGFYGFINKQGKFVFGPYFYPNFPIALYFSDGLVPVPFHLAKGICPYFPFEDDRFHRWGYLDKSFRMAIYPRFYAAKYFSEGLAPVLTEDGWGYIDRTGRIVIEPRFCDAYIFINGIAEVELENTYAFINRRGKIIWPPNADLMAN